MGKGSKLSPELQTITDAWKARVARHKTVHLRWTFEVLPESRDEGRVLLPHELSQRWKSTAGYVGGHRDFDVWLDGPDRFRGQVSIRVADRRGLDRRTVLNEAIRNGDVAAVRSDVDQPWRATSPVSGLTETEPWSQRMEQVLSVYRPTDDLREGWALRTENAVLDNIHCVKLVKTDINGLLQTAWLDTARGYLPLHVEIRDIDHVQSWSYEYRPAANGLVALTTCYGQTFDSPVTYTTRARVTEAAINPPVPTGLFDPSASPPISSVVRAKLPD